MRKNILKTIINTGLGFLFLGLGALGVVVPGLPTTPLLLLASYFFIRGSEKANNWFINTKLYHKFLKNYLEHRSMTLKTKIVILALATTMITTSFIVMPVLIGRILLVIAAFCMYYYFFKKIKTRNKDIFKIDNE